MNKFIIFIFCFLIALQKIKAQDNYTDSLKIQLSKSTKAIDSFYLITKISEHSLVLGGGIIDSSMVIRLLQIAKKLKNDSLLAISYNWIGSYMAFNSGENTAALESYFKAIPLAVKAKDKRRISSLYFDISLIYLSLKNKEEAFKNIIKGGANLPTSSSPIYSFMLMQFHRNMAAYYLLSEQYDSAIHYAQLLMETSKNIKSQNFQFAAFYILGSIYAQMGDIDLAEVYFKKAVEMRKYIQNQGALLSFYDIYIPYLLHNRRIMEAKNEASHLLVLGGQDDNNNLKLSAAGFLTMAFDSLHRFDSAYYFVKMKVQLNALIFSQNNINKMQSLAFNEQLRIIEENQKKAEEEEKRKQNLQYALIAVGIIILLMLYLLLSRSFITNTKLIEFFGVIALLIVFEFLNLLLHPFLEEFTDHSPLLMLLSLVCIASLLVPMHHRVEKWATQKLIDKNRKVRLAAAKKTIVELEGLSKIK